MKKIRRRHRRYNNLMWLYSVIASICLLTMGVGYAILSSENNIQIDVTKTEAEIVLSGNLLTSLKQEGISGEGRLEKITHRWITQTDSQVSYRYRGKNPNNYVTFNNELWRIIGIVDGKVKLIRNESIGEYAWNFNDCSVREPGVVELSNNLYEDIIAVPMAPEIDIYIGSNDWKKASLNTYLNSEYYNNLNMEAKKMIVESTWFFGSRGTPNITVNQIYRFEKELEETMKNIAIMNASDYGYAAEESCSESYNLGNYSNTTCTSNNWLYKGIDEWTLTTDSRSSSRAFKVDSTGTVVSYKYVCDSYNIRPTLYLNENVQITRGDGSSSNPYQLTLN